MTPMGDAGAGQEKCGNAGKMRDLGGVCRRWAITFIGGLSNRCRKMEQPGERVGSGAQTLDLEGNRLLKLAS